MRFELISDNTDSLVGMRLAGITGVIAHSEDEVKIALNNVAQKQDVAIILITEKLVDMCRDLVYELKNKCKQPLIVEIPGDISSGRKKDTITKYIRDAIGLKI